MRISPLIDVRCFCLLLEGVADQLQTNCATDLRHILKSVFECNMSEPVAKLDAAEDDEMRHSDDEATPEDGDGAPGERISQRLLRG